jgi:hypothetical protein
MHVDLLLIGLDVYAVNNLFNICVEEYTIIVQTWNVPIIVNDLHGQVKDWCFGLISFGSSSKSLPLQFLLYSSSHVYCAHYFILCFTMLYVWLKYRVTMWYCSLNLFMILMSYSRSKMLLYLIVFSHCCDQAKKIITPADWFLKIFCWSFHSLADKEKSLQSMSLIKWIRTWWF